MHLKDTVDAYSADGNKNFQRQISKRKRNIQKKEKQTRQHLQPKLFRNYIKKKNKTLKV